MADVRTWDQKTIDDTTLMGVHHVLNIVELEEIPDEQPPTFEARSLRLRANHPPDRPVHHWLANDAGVVGTGYALRWPDDDPANSFIWVGVLPEHRRRGIGRKMVSAMLATLEDAGCSMVIIDCPAEAPMNSVLERLGLKHVFTERRSRLWIADIDWGLMDTWIERAAERATDYHLLYLQTPIPDEHLEQWCAVNNVMNTAPREELEFADMILTPEKWRAIEQTLASRDESVSAYVAVHTPSSEFVGYTDVGMQRLRPDLAYQKDTAVDPAHRDLGLGRWLKAAMARRIAEENGEVTRIYTGNAGSNEAMLGINDEMGFKPVQWLNAWQGDIAGLRSALSSVT